MTVNENTRWNFKVGAAAGVVAVAVTFIVSCTWKVAIFMRKVEEHQQSTDQHFESIEKQLASARVYAERQQDSLGLIKMRQDVVIQNYWTSTDMQNWVHQLDRANRQLDNGKGLNVPDTDKITKKNL